MNAVQFAIERMVQRKRSALRAAVANHLHRQLRNSKGPCVICGERLGWYDSKHIGRGEGNIACVSHNLHWPEWGYYTDG